YRKWCKTNNFTSMLPQDVKERKTAAAIINAQQSNLDGHLCKIPPHQAVVTYSNSHFHEAAIEWLISTGQ
ncbi:hypothetical protein M405DRAFT_684976, partial [Rhizopogon salebrosus TDB-379]